MNCLKSRLQFLESFAKMEVNNIYGKEGAYGPRTARQPHQGSKARQKADPDRGGRQLYHPQYAQPD